MKKKVTTIVMIAMMVSLFAGIAEARTVSALAKKSYVRLSNTTAEHIDMLYVIQSGHVEPLYTIHDIEAGEAFYVKLDPSKSYTCRVVDFAAIQISEGDAPGIKTWTFNVRSSSIRLVSYYNIPHDIYRNALRLY